MGLLSGINKPRRTRDSSESERSNTRLSEPVRLKRPRWNDPRLLVGILLVLASVAGCLWLVRSAQKTQTYLVASSTVPAGSRVTRDVLVEKEMNLSDSDASYVKPSDFPEGGFLLRQTIRKGEVMSKSAVAVESSSTGKRMYALTLTQPLPVGAEVGRDVEIWESLRSKKSAAEGYGEAEKIIDSAEVIRVELPGSSLGSSGKTILHLSVSPQGLKKLMAAVSRESKIHVSLLSEKQ